MITVEQYKEHLINLSFCGYDCTDQKLQERKRTLNREYGYDLLQKIVDDTYSFIGDVITDETIEKGYCSFELEDDTTDWISLGLVGGHSSDTLFTDMQGRIISRYIMHQVFGDYLQIDVREDEIPFDTGDDIMSFDYRYSLYMQGFPNNLKEIKEELFGKNKQLTKEGKHGI